MSNKISIKKLKQHPKNSQIYGNEEESIKELADKIKQSGWVKPLVINKDFVILSGHRRYQACKILGINEAEYEIASFENETSEVERLLLENESRVKTVYQKLQEGKMWEEIQKIKAKERMSKGVEKIPQQEKGKTRDIVAEKIGIGSGKTYESAKKVGEQIDKLKEEGKGKDAEVLTEVLNASITGAKDIVKLNSLDSISDDLKDKIIAKEVSAKEAIKEIKKESNNIHQNDIKIFNPILEGKTIDENSNEILYEETLETKSSESKEVTIKSEAKTTINKIIGLLKEVFTEEIQEIVEDMTREDKDIIQDVFTKLENEIKNIKMCTN